MIFKSDQQKFAEELLPNIANFLTEAVDWIMTYLEPEDVFNESQLEAWARSKGFVKKEEIND